MFYNFSNPKRHNTAYNTRAHILDPQRQITKSSDNRGVHAPSMVRWSTVVCFRVERLQTVAERYIKRLKKGHVVQMGELIARIVLLRRNNTTAHRWHSSGVSRAQHVWPRLVKLFICAKKRRRIKAFRQINAQCASVGEVVRLLNHSLAC